ncbi:MAG TPA: glycosyltransferase, partial [Thermoleophilaceae bacterium]|nr:glycosyltransferase [Thermoleophilaceae bacterium]
RSPAELTALARTHLSRGDTAAYLTLFADVASDTDPHRRFRARRALLEAGMNATVPAKLAPKVLLAGARASVELLEEEPREPVILNYGGVFFYELGALGPAEQLFKAAKRLDPDLPHVGRNLEELARRRRKNIDVLRALPAPVTLELGRLAKRVERIAGRAKPAEGMRISLVMIVKDEEEMLPRSLEAIHDVVDEMIIVDTGSTDRTVEIAESFGAKVLHHEWTGDFAEARNVSLEAATGDWFIYLDADEVLVREDAERLRELAGHVWREAFFLTEINFTGDLDDGMAVHHNALRMYRNRPEYRFEGRIHEQLAQTLPAGLPARVEQPSVRIEHYGYLGAVRDAKEKSRRNIELLERQLSEGEVSSFLCFNLGSEYAAAGEAERALDRFEQAWEILGQDPYMSSYGFVPSLTNRLVKALRTTGNLELAVERAKEGLEIFPGFTDLVLEQAHCAREQGDLEAAAELIKECLRMGDAPSRYSAMVGTGSYIALGALADIRRLQGDFAECERLLMESLREHPGYLGAVHPLAGIMLVRGAEPAAVVDTIESLVKKLTPSAHFMLGSALYEQRHAEEAEVQFRAVLELQPSSDPARVALSEALLSQRRWEEAAEAAAEVDDASGYVLVARRSELFGRVMAGDAEACERAFARAQAAGMLAADLQLFRAWEAVRRGAAPVAVLPIECGSLLALTMEALLRVEEVEAFAELLPLVDAVGIPRRERRELLGAMYLRRGFLESAGDEWVAACQEHGPDARSLFGLAQVAAARGLLEDAQMFAEETRRLEPEHSGAGMLLDALAAAA